MYIHLPGLFWRLPVLLPQGLKVTSPNIRHPEHRYLQLNQASELPFVVSGEKQAFSGTRVRDLLIPDWSVLDI